jgi:hypothetical protein
MCSKQNGAASVRCHRAMNWPILVARTGLWASCEPLRRHVLNIVRPYIFRDVYRFEIPLNRNIVPALEIPISRFFIAFFCASYQKSRNLLHATKNYISKHNFCLKQILYCFQCYLVAAWFSHTLLAIVLCSLSQQNLSCVLISNFK